MSNRDNEAMIYLAQVIGGSIVGLITGFGMGMVIWPWLLGY